MKGADSIELKLTLPEHSYRSAAAALGVDPLDAQIRQVFFFDTPDLDLNKAGVVARARRVQGRGDDSVVKLRPVVPAELSASLRKLPEFVVEVDALPGGYVCSASLKGVPKASVRETVSGKGPLSKVFSKNQRSFFEEHAPAGLTIDALDVLGPIFVLKLKLSPKAFGRRLVAEMWLYPDGSRIVELSTKCLPGEGLDVAEQLLGFLASKDISTDGEQQTKTKTRSSSSRPSCTPGEEPIVDQVDAILDEALKEAVGISSKKWALVVVALVVGAMSAFWLVRRARSAEPDATPVEVDTT